MIRRENDAPPGLREVLGIDTFDGAVVLLRFTVPPGFEFGRMRGIEHFTAVINPPEAAILALRTSAGIDGVTAARGPVAAVLGWAVDAGLVDRRNGGVALTLRGRLLSNELFTRLV